MENRKARKEEREVWRRNQADLLRHRLEEVYPQAHCELRYRNALELLVATILSAQCTDARVNVVTERLFERCRSAKDYAEIALGELEGLVQSTGFFRSKAKHIQGCARALLERHGGEVPARLEALVQLPGVGRKTANVVLGEIFGKPEGIVVDTHVKRLSVRLGLSEARTPEKVEQDLMEVVPQADWAKWSHLMIWHGRRRCFARKPDCSGCELRLVCPSAEGGTGGGVALEKTKREGVGQGTRSAKRRGAGAGASG